MLRSIFRLAILAIALISGSNITSADVNIKVDNPDVSVFVKVKPKAESSQPTWGYYVFVASAPEDGVLEVSSVMSAYGRIGTRPKMGMTTPSSGGFSVSVLAVYYGPYANVQDAKEIRDAVKEHVSDAFIKSGYIQRF